MEMPCWFARCTRTFRFVLLHVGSDRGNSGGGGGDCGGGGGGEVGLCDRNVSRRVEECVYMLCRVVGSIL